MLKAIFFDLDGTLLPLDEKVFTEEYFSLLCRKMAPRGYEAQPLVKNIWAGTKAMITNDGSRTNEQAFWDYFAAAYGAESLRDKDVISDFYRHEFALTKRVCGENPYAREIVSFCRSRSLKVILSTNPVFPRDGVLTRMGFVGLKEEDFDYITTYENSRFCKPNPLYFQELLSRFSLRAEEVAVFGNNEKEDGDCAAALSIPAYMIGDFTIDNPPEGNHYPHIPMPDVVTTISSLLAE